VLLSAVILLICSSVPDKVTGKEPLCDPIHHVRMLTAEDIRKNVPETEHVSDMQLCFMSWAIAAQMDGSSTVGNGEYIRVICRIGPESKPETPK
jgi:hypothetical protein